MRNSNHTFWLSAGVIVIMLCAGSVGQRTLTNRECPVDQKKTKPTGEQSHQTKLNILYTDVVMRQIKRKIIPCQGPGGPHGTTLSITIPPNCITDFPDDKEVVMRYRIHQKNVQAIKKARLLILVHQNVSRRELRKLSPYVRARGMTIHGRPMRKGKLVAFDVTPVLQSIFSGQLDVDYNMTFDLWVTGQDEKQMSPWRVFSIEEGHNGPLLDIKYKKPKCHRTGWFATLTLEVAPKLSHHVPAMRRVWTTLRSSKFRLFSRRRN